MNNAFLEIPENTKVSIILRHAERDPIRDWKNPIDALLTDKGHRDAFLLSKILKKFSPYDIYHSPVPRCRETADNIYKGLIEMNEKVTLKGQLFDLGGPYITGDWRIIAEQVKTIGPSVFLRKWFSNEFPPELILPLPEAAEQQLKVHINHLDKSDHSTISISHDWNIAILREFYFNIQHEDSGMPEFLDGIYFYYHDNKLHLRYHDHLKVFESTI